MSDFATDEKEFEADSWSLAVDNNYLQQHKKDVMKRQDVIYGEHWELGRMAYSTLTVIWGSVYPVFSPKIHPFFSQLNLV